MSIAKVCMLTTGHSPLDIRIFHKESKALMAAGYKVAIIAPCESNGVVDGVQIVAVQPPRSRLERLTLTAWRAFRQALRVRASVYHFCGPELIPYALLLTFSGKRVVYDVLEDLPGQIQYKTWIPRGWRPLVAWLYKQLEHFSARRFSAIIAAGPEIAERFSRVNGHIALVQNFPLLDEFPESPRARSNTVVCLGGVQSAHMIRETIHAMNLLPGTLGVRLILAGSIESDSLLQEVSRLPGWQDVEYRGVLARREISALLAGAAATVVLYSPEPNHLDVKSNRFFESLAAGLPVIVSNFPKWHALVAELGCGLAVDPLDPRAIANAIEYLLSHPDEAAEMGKRGRRAAIEKYSWTTEKQKLLDCYARLFTGRAVEANCSHEDGRSLINRHEHIDPRLGE